MYIWYKIDINLKFNLIIYFLLNWKINQKKEKRLLIKCWLSV